VDFFSNRSAIDTKWSTQTFPPVFGLFAIFDRNFANIVAPSSDENENYVALLKRQSVLKKNVENTSKLIHKPRRNDHSNYAPPRQTHGPPDRSETEKNNNTF